MDTIARPFDSVLIANRGEIARRIIRSAHRLGLRTIAVYSEADRHALYVSEADEAVYIGPAPARESYLNIDSLLAAARASGAEAIHPGYGFLAESATFATAVKAAGLVFVGPAAEAIKAMGNKVHAKDLMERAEVPTVPGFRDSQATDEAFVAAAAAIGYPVMIKAAAGGGGRGMRIVHDAVQLAVALPSARSEALSAFGSGELLLERVIVRPRHIEIQILADMYGHVVHLGERDCSVQRRHQKVIEETPSPAVDSALRERMTHSAIAAARAIGYVGTGTLEYLLAPDGEFYFMEMNTRLQVEHAVTEGVTGLDLVEWQLRIAAGEPLGFAQDNIRFQGHAIEARLCAEAPEDDFLPQSGPVLLWRPPTCEVRVDHNLASGSEISPFYDSMVAKLVTHAPSRQEAIRKLRRALEECVLLGTRTNQSFLIDCLARESFVAGDVHTGFIAEHFPEGVQAHILSPAALALIACLRAGATISNASFGRIPARSIKFSSAGREYHLRAQQNDAGSWSVWGDISDEQLPTLNIRDISFESDKLSGEVDHRRISLTLAMDGSTLYAAERGRSATLHFADPLAQQNSADGDGSLCAPISGRVVAIGTTEGSTVKTGDVIVVLEAMKMEHSLLAPFDGIVEILGVKSGDQTRPGQLLARITRTEGNT